MNDMNFELVDVSQLKVGMYVELELGWMAHPFPTSSFKISSDKQVETIRSLGLQRVKFVPSKSDPEFDTQAIATAAEAAAAKAARDAVAAAERNKRKLTSDLLSAQQRGLAVCEKRFGETVRQYKQVAEQAAAKPKTPPRNAWGWSMGWWARCWWRASPPSDCCPRASATVPPCTRSTSP